MLHRHLQAVFKRLIGDSSTCIDKSVLICRFADRMSPCLQPIIARRTVLSVGVQQSGGESGHSGGTIPDRGCRDDQDPMVKQKYTT
jgi:hypothetical protein